MQPWTTLRAVACIKKVVGTRSWSLWKETELLFTAVIQLNISIHARFISGKVNVIADDLFRGGKILPAEWSLYQDIVNHVFNQWGHPNLDLFATNTSA